ncbi:putative FAD-dependent dehydrogenase-like protein [Balamuthia mandrillaris]
MLNPPPPCAFLLNNIGPAGLCACALLQERNCDFLLIDAGRSIHERSRHDPLQCAEGVGGAGLFSDGKFSFYPSSSALWQLPDRPLLQRSYQRVVRDLQEYGLGGADGLPSFPTTAIEKKKESTGEERREEGKGEEWELKRYPSFYMSLEDRLRLTQRYADGLPALLETKVMDVTFKRRNGTDKEEEAEDLVCCKVVVQRRQREQPHKTKVSAESSSSEEEEEEEHDEKEDGEEVQLLYCKRLIFGGGRFGPLLFPKQESVFRRMEVGVRVQDRSHNPFFSRIKLLDPKYKLTIPSSSFFHSSHSSVDGRTEEEATTIEWRTFCCCREGEVVEAGPGGFFSGRSDCPPTGLSNIGFNLRCCSEKDALLCGQKLGNDFQGPLLRFLAEREDCFVAVGLRKLCDSFPELLTESSQVIGPTMEGVGFYPELEEGGGLRSLWIVGDSSGVFRGIVAAMVSGYYVAQEVLETLSKKMH